MDNVNLSSARWVMRALRGKSLAAEIMVRLEEDSNQLLNVIKYLSQIFDLIFFY